MAWTNENSGGTSSGVAAFNSTNILRANLVSELATGGTGTSGDPWTGWETAVNALPTYSRIHFPAGNYLLASTITIKQGWHISGDGRGGTGLSGATTRITSTITGTAIQGTFTIGGGGPGLGIRIHDLLLENTNAANVGSGILIIGGYYWDIDHVMIEGFRVGVCNIGSSRWSFSHGTLELQSKIGFWLSDGVTYTVANGFDQSPTGGIGTGAFTGDDGHIFDTNTNHAATAAGVVLEANYAVTVGPNMKFNGGDRHVWLSAMDGMQICGGTFEAAAAENIRLSSTYYIGGAASGVNLAIVVGPGSQFSNLTGNPAIYGENSNNLLVFGNTFSLTAPTYAIGNAFFVTNVTTWGNRIISGTGMVDGGSSSSNAFIDDAYGAFLYPGASTGSYFTNARIPNLRTDYVRMATGANTRMGTATLPASSPNNIVVSNTSVTANTVIFLTRATTVVSPGHLSYSINPGTSFTINSVNTADNSNINWLLIEPN